MVIDEEWQAIKVVKLEPEEFEKLLGHDDVYVLDVRPLDFERDTTFIKGSRHCPLVFLAQKYQEIPREKRILITDWAMKQSITAGKFLAKKGYQVAGVLKGGVERWKSEKFHVEDRQPTKTIGSLDPAAKN